jgi:hypothetical protein
VTRFWLIKAVGGPGSAGFFLAVAAIALILIAVSRRTRRSGLRLLVLLGVVYLFLSLPVVGEFMAGGTRVFDVSRMAELSGIEDVFVFDGDSYESRAALAGDLDRSMKIRNVWILGYIQLRDALVDGGVADGHLRWGYTEGDTTYGQVVRMRKLMEHYKIPRAAAVTSRVQATRVRQLIERSGVNAVVVASAMNLEPNATGLWRFVPSRAALALSRDGLYERAALLYYRWNDWI